MVSPRFFSTLFAVVLLQSAYGRLNVHAHYSADRMNDDDDAVGVASPETEDGQTTVATLVDPCKDNPCENNGICMQKQRYLKEPKGLRCECLYNSFGSRCEIKREYGECCVGGCKSFRQLNISVTKSGRTCQRWDVNEPHKHVYHPGKYSHYGLQENYCRNPSGWGRLWCYTTDPDKRWEECDLSFCSVEKLGIQADSLILSTIKRVAEWAQVWGRKSDGLAYIFNRSWWGFTKEEDVIPMVKSLISKGYSVEGATKEAVRYYGGLTNGTHFEPQNHVWP